MNSQQIDPPTSQPFIRLTSCLRHREAEQILTAVGAGAAIGVMLVLMMVSFASLIYPATIAGVLARGIGITLLGAAVLTGISALGSGFHAAVVCPQESTTAILAGVAAASVAAMPPGTTSTTVFATIVATVVISAVITGASLFALGRLKLGGLARFLPYPVIGGFLAGTGWLLTVGAVELMTAVVPSLETLSTLLGWEVVIRWLPGLAVAAALVLALRRFHPLLAILGTLLTAIAVFYLVLWLSGTSHAVATTAGWLLGPFPAGALLQPLRPADLAQVHWPAIAAQASGSATVPLIAAIVLLLDASGIELAVSQDFDLNRELTAIGTANLAAAVVGGVPGHYTVSLSVLMHRMGVRSRLGGVVTAVVMLLPLLLSAALLAYLPKFVLGGLLLFFGWSFLSEWVIAGWRRLPRLDYAIVLLILAVVAVRGFLAGVGVGLVAVVALFVVEYSRVRVVRRVLTSATRRSRFTRAPAQRQFLDVQGERISIVELQGYLFFGTAARLLDRIRAQVGGRAALGPGFLVLDLAQVTGLDSSALYAFTTLGRLASVHQFTVVVTGAAARLKRQIASAVAEATQAGWLRMEPDLDRGIEWCEAALIQAAALPTTHYTPLEEQLATVLPNRADLDRLLGYLERREVAAGTQLMAQGAVADDLYFIAAGQVTAQLERDGYAPLRLQTVAGGNVVGEIGLYLGTLRTSTVVCDTPCMLYRLSAAALVQMRTAEPDLAAAVHAHIAGVMAERLIHTTRALDAALEP